MARCGCATASTRPSRDLFPCFYGGGGSCAFDREKFLELGGFDPLLAPFYLEDTDLGYMAWKRGWKVLYQPRSVVYHEHRGTIGKRFRRGADPGGAQEELHPVLLEEHPRVAAAGLTFLLHLCGCAGERGVRRRARPREPGGAVAGLLAAAAGHAVAWRRAQRWRLSTIPRRSGAPWAATSAIASP